MATQNIFDLTDTWNNVATTFAAVKMNVTDTASAAGSLLMDLQVGGVSRFQVTKGGNLIRNAGSYQTTIENERIIIAAPSGGGPNLVLTQTGIAAISLTNVASTGVFALSGATIFEQRNGTSAQTHRWYRSFTDTSNYSRIALGWSSSTAILATEGAGTGSRGNIAFGSAALATSATVGYVMIPSCAGAPTGVPADIPTGQVALHYDSTNHKIYVYSGAWRSTAALT